MLVLRLLVMSVVALGSTGCPKRQAESNPAVPPTDGAVVALLQCDVFFRSGSDALVHEAIAELDELANTIRTQYPDREIEVAGYSDASPIPHARPGKLLKMSQARAEAVKSRLVTKGVSADRVTAIGRGTANPRATKALSRRVEVIVKSPS